MYRMIRNNWLDTTIVCPRLWPQKSLTTNRKMPNETCRYFAMICDRNVFFNNQFTLASGSMKTTRDRRFNHVNTIVYAIVYDKK